VKKLICLLFIVIVFGVTGCNSQSQEMLGDYMEAYDQTNDDIVANDDYNDESYDHNSNYIAEIEDFPRSIEWVSHHPWREDYNLEFMPVFRNHFHMIPEDIAQHPGLTANSLSDEDMIREAARIFEAMGHHILITGPDPNSIWSNGVMVMSEDVRVGVEAIGFAQVYFRDGLPLPEGLTLPPWSYPHAPNNPAIKYLTEKFSHALGVAQRDFENTKDDIIPRILDYHFNTISFLPMFTSDGAMLDILEEIRRPLPIDIVLSDKIGYFPIITPDEAIQRMLDGQGSFGVDMGQTRPTEDDIIDTHLVYFGHMLGRNQVEFFTPWYRFTVLTADTNHLQYYFVPAIVTEYLEANPAWAFYPHQ